MRQIYAEGMTAFDDGLTSEDCPYPHNYGFNSSRYYWFTGYYDRKHQIQLNIEPPIRDFVKEIKEDSKLT